MGVGNGRGVRLARARALDAERRDGHPLMRDVPTRCAETWIDPVPKARGVLDRHCTSGQPAMAIMITIRRLGAPVGSDRRPDGLGPPRRCPKESRAHLAYLLPYEDSMCDRRRRYCNFRFSATTPARSDDWPLV